MVHLSSLRTHRRHLRSVCGAPRASVGFRLDSGRRKRYRPVKGAKEYLHRGSRGSYKSSKATWTCEGSQEYLHRSSSGSYKSSKATWPCEGVEEYLHRGFRGSYKSSKVIVAL